MRMGLIIQNKPKQIVIDGESVTEPNPRFCVIFEREGLRAIHCGDCFNVVDKCIYHPVRMEFSSKHGWFFCDSKGFFAKAETGMAVYL